MYRRFLLTLLMLIPAWAIAQGVTDVDHRIKELEKLISSASTELDSLRALKPILQKIYGHFNEGGIVLKSPERVAVFARESIMGEPMYYIEPETPTQIKGITDDGRMYTCEAVDGRRGYMLSVSFYTPDSLNFG